MESNAIQNKKALATTDTLQTLFLFCGILSSLLYVSLNIVAVMLYKGYSPVSQTVSELSAIGTPTRSLWVSLVTLYSMLVIAFGLGVWKSAADSRRLRVVAIMLIADAVIGFFWPPMHQREVLAAGGKTITDTLHIIFTAVTVPLMMLAIGFGAAALGRKFRIFSIITLLILIVAGILTSIDGPKIEANLPTPFIGVWERINIGVYMLWVVVLAIILLRRQTRQSQ